MTAVGASAQARPRRAALVPRTLTRPGVSAFDLLEWAERSVRITAADGSVVFRRNHTKAPAR